MPELEAQLDAAVTTSLKHTLADRIRREGPMTFHDWMRAALYDPVFGYYRRADLPRWGREGDYRTSPERSELFAATFARYFSQLYEKLDRPAKFTILECGAGDGSFACGVLSYLSEHLPNVFEVTRYLVDEVSEDSRNRIRERISDFRDRVDLISLSDLATLGHAVVFSNELLDAFPVHRLQMADGILRELHVSLDADGEFVWLLGTLSTPWLEQFVQASSVQLVESQIIEVSPRIEKWFGVLATKLGRGYVVTVDYGREAGDLYDFNERPEGTLRSYSRHRFESVLECPGEFDITSSVDWSYVKRCGLANDLIVADFERLDQFMVKAGLLDELSKRLERLASDSDKLRLTTAAREMILPGGMASNFQVLVQTRN